MKIWENKRAIFDKFKRSILFILTVALTAFITTIINRIIENPGKPEITAKIESVLFLEEIKTREWKGKVFLNITNLEDKPTFIGINAINLLIPQIERREAVLKVNSKIPLNSYENINDTISFQIPERLWFKYDSLTTIPILVEIKLYYPSGELAQDIKFDCINSNFILYEYFWEKQPLDYYYFLRNQSKKNSLPKGWKRWNINFRGKEYGCYYYPDSVTLKISYSGERMRIYPRDPEFNRIPLKENKKTTLEIYTFIADPEIEDRFIDLKKRSFMIVSEERGKDKVISIERKITVYEGYRHLFFYKY